MFHYTYYTPIFQPWLTDTMVTAHGVCLLLCLDVRKQLEDDCLHAVESVLGLVKDN